MRVRPVLSVALRLLVYYIIYLSVWVCPPQSLHDPDVTAITPLEADAPALCYPLHTVFGLLDPVLGPLHAAHVAPIRKAVTPYTAAVCWSYRTYAEPHVLRTAAYAVKVSEPARTRAAQLYAQHLGVHIGPVVDKVQGVYSSQVVPGAQVAVAYADQIHNSYVAPVVRYIVPHLQAAQAVLYRRVVPVAQQWYGVASDKTSQFATIAWTTLHSKLGVHISNLYRRQVEPQLIKIHNKITQSSSTAVTGSGSFVTKSVTAESEPEPVISEPVTSDPVTSDPVTSDPATSEPSTVQPATTEPGTEPASVPTESPPSASVADELDRWRALVDHTTKDALNNFLDEIEADKKALIDQARPQFTELLQAMQHVQRTEADKLAQLVLDLNDGDTDLSSAAVQDLFRTAADNIRQAAQKVRDHAQTVAEQALARCNALRDTTVDVLDEFSEIALQELGRKMVSDRDPTASSNELPKWQNWKEYRALKDQLYGARDAIVDHDFDMADVNAMLRDAQETANVLAREAAHLLSQIRLSADAVLQERIAARAVELNGQDEYPEDAEIYYEIEGEDETETETETETTSLVDEITTTLTSTRTVVVPSETVLSETLLSESSETQSTDEPSESELDLDQVSASILPVSPGAPEASTQN